MMSARAKTNPHDVVRQIAEYAEAIAFQAGVGSSETAGQIVSFLWERPSLMPAFMASTLSAVDTGMLEPHNGVLSWHGQDGAIHRPDPSKARFPAPLPEPLPGRVAFVANAGAGPVRDATDAMIEAGLQVDMTNEDERAILHNIWHAMVAAHPAGAGPVGEGVAARAGIYVASKTRHAPMWKGYRERGWPINSTWIDEAGVGESSDLNDLWRRCVAEASSARVLVVYREADDVLKGGWVEVGAALASGVPVYAVGLEGFSIAYDKRIRHFETLDDAMEAVDREEAVLAPRPVEEPGEVERLTRELPRFRDERSYVVGWNDGYEEANKHHEVALAETRERLEKANAERAQLLADLQLLRTEMATAVTDMQDRAEAAEARIFLFETEARRYAGMYPEGSDGRNTFVIFADMVAEHTARPSEPKRFDAV